MHGTECWPLFNTLPSVQSLAMQSEQTMAEQEAALGQLRDQLTEVRASHAQLEQALASSTAESQATIEALRSSMACASSEALELAQRRYTPQLLWPASPCFLAPSQVVLIRWMSEAWKAVMHFVE